MNWKIFMSLLIIALAVNGQNRPDATKTDSRRSVVVISIDGTISPTSSNYIHRGINKASAQGAECLVIELNTPGGLLESTQNIVQAFLRFQGA